MTSFSPEPEGLFMYIFGDWDWLYDGEKELAFSSINFMINHDFVADFLRQQTSRDLGLIRTLEPCPSAVAGYHRNNGNQIEGDIKKKRRKNVKDTK